LNPFPEQAGGDDLFNLNNILVDSKFIKEDFLKHVNLSNENDTQKDYFYFSSLLTYDMQSL